jgi:hypothetical protein
MQVRIVMIRDFNEMMWQSEHLSTTRRSGRQMADFREVLAWCDLHDLGYKGPSWTYNNKQIGRSNVKARLDRGTATPGWSRRFPNASIEHICSTRSDHFPLLLQFGKKWEYHRKKEFKYEAMWEREELLLSVVGNVWKSAAPATTLHEVQAKLFAMQSELGKWSAASFGSVKRQTSRL